MTNVQLVVSYFNGQTGYYPVKTSWKVDESKRILIVGKGVPRKIIPLDSIACIDIEPIENTKVKQGELIKTGLGLEVRALDYPNNRLFIGHSSDVYDVINFLFENFNVIFTQWMKTGGKKDE